MTPIRILLVQSDPQEAFFVKDALDECGWLVDVTRAETLDDALAILMRTPIDLVLLDLDLPDSRKSWTFLPVHATASHIPIILLVDAEHASLAARLVREGAQDYLLRSEIDCIPLRRAILNAIERNHLLEAARADGVIDPPTGLLNSRGFLMHGEVLRQAALKFHAPLRLYLATCNVTDPEERNLILLGLTDRLRESVGTLHAIARIDPHRVAAIVVDPPRGLLLNCDQMEIDPREPITLDVVDEIALRA